MWQILVFMSNNKNELKVIKTEDGSFSIYNELLDETYHSKHGAMQESMHVFIKNGLNLVVHKAFNILEIGLGTGLNTALTILEAKKFNLEINYITLEPFPLNHHIIAEVAKGYNKEIGETLLAIEQFEWGKDIQVLKKIKLLKLKNEVQTFHLDVKLDLIYFDAFAPEKQPEMWELEIFIKLFNLLNIGGILTTYCAKGQFKRNLKQAGFLIKSVPGPPGKREMIVAYKIS